MGKEMALDIIKLSKKITTIDASIKGKYQQIETDFNKMKERLNTLLEKDRKR
jgi:flagellar capping protein FliD